MTRRLSHRALLNLHTSCSQVESNVTLLRRSAGTQVGGMGGPEKSVAALAIAEEDTGPMFILVKEYLEPEQL